MFDRDKVIQRCIEGEPSAQEALYKHYASKLKGICMRYTKNKAEAEDILQDSFIKIFNALDKYSGEGSFEGWIRRVVVNTSIDAYKKSKKTTDNWLSLEDTDQFDVASLDDVTDQMSANELLDVLKRLPDGYKMVFNLYAIEGYTHKEIGEMLGITEGTSKSQLSKARTYIQNILQQIQIIEDEQRRAQ